MRAKSKIAAFGLFALGFIVVTLGGCYYEVRDARTGRMYYTDKWVAADGYRGPLTFVDHTGVQRRIEMADVQRIAKQDYLDATEPAEPSSPAGAAPNPAASSAPPAQP